MKRKKLSFCAALAASFLVTAPAIVSPAGFDFAVHASADEISDYGVIFTFSDTGILVSNSSASGYKISEESAAYDTTGADTRYTLTINKAGTYCISKYTPKCIKKNLHDKISRKDSAKTKYDLEKFPYPIFNNCLPHIDIFLENGYTKEEEKMINETRKILGKQDLAITATTVRVPVFNSHCESINIELEKEFELKHVIEVLKSAPGVIVQDNPSQELYAIPTEVSGHNEIFVSRIRRDFSVKNGLNIWVVADNIRKGAATNAVQIAEKLLERL